MKKRLKPLIERPILVLTPLKRCVNESGEEFCLAPNAPPWPVVISTNQPSEVWTSLESNAYDAGTKHAAGFSTK
jgi:hypothetical protein